MAVIKKIVLTGGPCAGKTTALVRLIDHFSNLGYKVYTIPEVPTIFLQAGMYYLTKNADLFYEGELATLRIQLDFEDHFMRMAKTHDEPVLIICDRGVMDISAYMDAELWQRLSKEVGLTTQQLRDERYDAVLHLVSAANGAEEYYNVTSNTERTEGIELARTLDKKVIDAWTGHPHLRVINNHDDFNAKIHRVIKEVSTILSLPQPIEEERKYIVEVIGPLPDSIESDLVQTYLSGDPGSEIRLRQLTLNGRKVYVHTTKKRTSASEQIETERQISANLYNSMLQQADPYRQTIHKRRNSFIWEGQYFELDTYLTPRAGLVILETKGITAQESVKFPSFLRVVEDITGRTQYYNYNLALRG
jgi:CYTH domain-containing protein/thymidylate kinase